MQNIAIWHDKLGWDADKIAGEFGLELTDIYAALSHYFAHQEKIDQSIEENEAIVREMSHQASSLLEQKLKGKP